MKIYSQLIGLPGMLVTAPSDTVRRSRGTRNAPRRYEFVSHERRL
jgi:hypothetical protein